MPQTLLEERVAYLEGRVEEHSKAWEDIKDMIIRLDQRITFLDQKVDRFRDELSERINSLDQRLSSRIDALDSRIDALDQRLSSRIDALDQRLSSRIDALDSRIDALDQRLSSRIDALDHKVSRFFIWIIGIQVTMFISIIAVFLGLGR